jgi:hypothetical protein
MAVPPVDPAIGRLVWWDDRRVRRGRVGGVGNGDDGMNWLAFLVFAFIFLLLIIPVAYWGTKYRAWYAKRILSLTPVQKKRWINFIINRNFYLAIIGLILFKKVGFY